ncbi:YhgE/Pip domain-containing protein [Pseudobutyrivibrio sp.]|uniref:YhgE/Pip domain-containing protein n=1 Tax=Pseudobutyrivibrio sp. TaxID=2014367 RepID=UPI001D3CE897|nr:YhgE/Pip domain-containing protein [Pseudobutyrivibrio sp.]MBE5911028.1 YhgE/Pip domain-containing protein [Pseudobutyrivibrio sp.]
MRNIVKIIASDIKRLSVNVVAMVVMIGLTVIPCLYAWFNILSNWDPYGPDATKNLQVAVASSDQGILVGNFELNVGDIIISNLKENTSIGWVFTDTAEEAISGVYSGDYYAALIIDEEFSANMISFLGGQIENPEITYYENDKKNAIAPKITGKVKTTIEREVDHAFVGTMAETLLNASEYFATLDEQGNITGQGIAKLEQLDSDMNGLIALLDSYIALSDSTESISEAGQAVADSASSITDLAGQIAENAQSQTASAQTDIQNYKYQLDAKIGDINTSLDSVDSTIETINSYVSQLSFGNAGNNDLMNNINSKMQELNTAWKDSNGDGIYSMIVNNPLINDSTTQGYIQDAADKVDNELGSLETNITNMNNAISTTEEEFNTAKANVIQDISDVIANTSGVRSAYASKISPIAQTAIYSVNDSIAEIEKLLDYNAESIDLVIDNLGNYADLMDQSKDSLVKSRDEAVEMEQQLSALIADIKSVGESEGYQKFMTLVKSDPELLSDFISSPVEVSNEYIYPVENNGSMTAPFYIVLSIWVGALIISTILKTTVKDTTGMENVKNWQCFFGRFFVTFGIGQIQTIITVLGAILFVGIQCEHHFLLWAACAWSAFVYSLLLYSFTYSFGNVGEALSVILMVIQVAGAGGTFPIEVLPKVFQVLYKFMPFKYSMTAVRECIAGFYNDTYKNCMLTLLIYVAVAIFIGVVLYHPFKIINEKIEHSKEKSGILL